MIPGVSLNPQMSEFKIAFFFRDKLLKKNKCEDYANNTFIGSTLHKLTNE